MFSELGLEQLMATRISARSTRSGEEEPRADQLDELSDAFSTRLPAIDQLVESGAAWMLTELRVLFGRASIVENARRVLLEEGWGLLGRQPSRSGSLRADERRSLDQRLFTPGQDADASLRWGSILPALSSYSLANILSEGLRTAASVHGSARM